MPDRIVANIQHIHDTLYGLAARPGLRAAFVSVQAAQFCSAEIRSAEFRGIRFDVLPDLAALRSSGATYDLCLLCCHNAGEEALLFDLRAAGFATLYALWFWDNHHHQIAQLRTAALADLVFPSHWHERQYLNHPATLPGVHVPICARQWSAGLLARLHPDGLPIQRRDALFGGFGRYSWVPERNAFITALMAACPDHALTLGPADEYFALPEAERLALWLGHKVQINVPIAGDVSTRLFETLLTGQIPLIPSDVADLDRVIPSALRASLPVLTFLPGSVESALDAWREGLRRYDAEGAAGVARRFAFARDHHSLSNRLAAFADFFRDPGRFTLNTDGRARFWTNWL